MCECFCICCLTFGDQIMKFVYHYFYRAFNEFNFVIVKKLAAHLGTIEYSYSI